MRRGEWRVPCKPHCFLQLLHDLVFANLPDEHVLGMEKSRHGGKSRGEVMVKFRGTLKEIIQDEKRQCQVRNVLWTGRWEGSQPLQMVQRASRDAAPHSLEALRPKQQAGGRLSEAGAATALILFRIGSRPAVYVY